MNQLGSSVGLDAGIIGPPGLIGIGSSLDCERIGTLGSALLVRVVNDGVAAGVIGPPGLNGNRESLVDCVSHMTGPPGLTLMRVSDVVGVEGIIVPPGLADI